MRPLESEVGVALTQEEALEAARMRDVVWNNWAITGMYGSVATYDLQIPFPDENQEVQLREPSARLLWNIAFIASGIHSHEYLVTSGHHEIICNKNDPTIQSTYRYLGKLEEWMDGDIKQYNSAKQFALTLDDTLFESRKLAMEQAYLSDGSFVMRVLPDQNL